MVRHGHGMTKRPSSGLRWVAVCAVLALGLAACAGGGGTTGAGTEGADSGTATTDSGTATAEPTGSDGAGDEGDPVPVRFAASAGASSMGLMAAIIKGEGIDAEHGLDLQISEFAPDAAEQALLTGQVDAGFFGVVSWAQVRNEGTDLVFLGPIQQNHGAVIVQADSEYESLEDLQGQTLATLNPVSGLYTTMQVLAAELGLSWENDFEVISGPPPGLIAFLEQGEVEGIVHFEPNTSQLLESGDYRAVMNLGERWREQTGGPLFMLGLATTGEWVRANADAAQRLQAMMEDTMALMAGDPELLGEYLTEFDLDPGVVEVAKERMAEIYIDESGSEIEDNARLILDRAEELGIIAEVPEPIFVDPA